METPIRIAIEKIEENLNKSIEYHKKLPENEIRLIVSGRIEALLFAHETLNNLLQTEKEVIKEAFEQGYRDAESEGGINEGRDISEYDDSNEYFNNKFKVNQ